MARFERESAELQLILDSIRTENVELKHTLEEKSQWIDVLEERTRACTEMHVRSNAPKSPCENESIGYSLLSLEVIFQTLSWSLYLNSMKQSMCFYLLYSTRAGRQIASGIKSLSERAGDPIRQV